MTQADRPRYKYYLKLFGKASISQERFEELFFSTRRAAQLLAILAVNPGRKFSRIELGRILWPDDFDDSNRVKFRQELLRLTATLGEASEIIVRDRNHVHLNPHLCSSDVAELEILTEQLRSSVDNNDHIHRQVLDITSREFLEGRSDPWIEEQRRGFTELRSESRAALGELGSEYPSFVHALNIEAGYRFLTKNSVMRVHSSVPELVSPVFCGRRNEVEELRRLILDEGTTRCRLITVLGPGGIGKTRVAQEVCNLARKWFDGRAWFVNLADQTHPDFILPKILNSLGLDRVPSSDQISLIGKSLRAGRGNSFLVLDNLEQFDDCGAKIISELLREVPDMSILCTSRRPVLISQEQQFWLTPLDTRNHNSAAARMFIELAKKIDRGFDPTPSEMATISEIVTMLEGVPLAISLAASRVMAITLDDLRDSLQNKVVSLSTHRRDLPERHQTLRGCIDWSYELLSEKYRIPFARLAIFSGGWFRENAQSVLGPEVTSDLMEELEANSLVFSTVIGEKRHFQMLECIREYAYEKLTTSEINQLKLAHVLALNEFCRDLPRHLMNGEQPSLIMRAKAEADNLREALLWSVDFRPELSQEFLSNQLSFWWFFSRYSEGIRLLEHVRIKCPIVKDAKWAMLCWKVGAMYVCKGEFFRASEYFETALDIYRRDKNADGMSATLYNLAELQRYSGKYQLAIETCRENLEWVDPGNARDVVFPRTSILECLIALGNLREAKLTLPFLLELADQSGDPLCQVLPYFSAMSLGIETCDFESAANALSLAGNIVSKTENPQMRATFLHLKGQLEIRQGQVDSGIQNLESSLTLFEHIDGLPDVAHVLSHLAGAVFPNQPVLALDLFIRSFELFEFFNSIGGQLNCCRKLLWLSETGSTTRRNLLIRQLEILVLDTDCLISPSNQREMSQLRILAGESSSHMEDRPSASVEELTVRQFFEFCAEHALDSSKTSSL